MPEVVFEDEHVKIICGDIIDVLSKNDPSTGRPFIAAKSIDMVMTSVPYLRQRRYTDDAWGWEESVTEWLDHMYGFSAYIAQALKDTGSFWFNSGDKWGGSSAGSDYGDKRFNEAPEGYSKIQSSKLRIDEVNRKGNLMMLPERAIIRLTDEKLFTLINKVIWWKRNRAVQSYQRKFVDTWEPLYFLAKNPDKYKFNRAKIGVEQRGEMSIMSMIEEDEDEEFKEQLSLSHDQPDLWHPVYDENHPPPFGTPEYRDWYMGTRAKQSWHDHADDAANGQHKQGAKNIDGSRTAPEFGRGQNSFGQSGAKGFGGTEDTNPAAQSNRITTKVLKHPDGANPGDMWDIPVTQDKFFSNDGIPPARRWPAWPVELCTLPILACTDEGDVILDPFGGSGTLAVAAKNLGRKCILVDIDKESCRIATVRYLKAQASLTGKQAGML